MGAHGPPEMSFLAPRHGPPAMSFLRKKEEKMSKEIPAWMQRCHKYLCAAKKRKRQLACVENDDMRKSRNKKRKTEGESPSLALAGS
jgi:hypothetical protein